MVRVTLPDGSGGKVGLGLQGSELGLMRAGAGVLLVPTHQTLEAGDSLLPAWGTTQVSQTEGRSQMSEELDLRRC